MEILGLIDTLEAMIMEGFRIPLTKKTILDEEELLDMVEKIKVVAKGGGEFARTAIGQKPVKGESRTQETLEFVNAIKDVEKVKEGLLTMPEGDLKAAEIMEKAYKIAKEVKMGADKYADEVLSNLEATSSRILRAVKAGRSRLGKFVTGTSQYETRPEEK